MKETILDNPAWGALTSEHVPFAQGTALAKRYQREIAPFAAVDATNNKNLAGLDPWINKGESLLMIGELPPLPEGWTMESELPCVQMVLKTMPAPLTAADEGMLSLLKAEDANEMYHLINSIQPGYYKLDTRLLGNYYGIRVEGKLVAMAGERLRMTGFTELSAICTHPDFTGRGLAQKLITRLCHQHAANGITSFLHVALSNERAIRLYEHMGFEQRRAISFYWLKRQ